MLGSAAIGRISGRMRRVKNSLKDEKIIFEIVLHIYTAALCKALFIIGTERRESRNAPHTRDTHRALSSRSSTLPGTVSYRMRSAPPSLLVSALAFSLCGDAVLPFCFFSFSFLSLFVAYSFLIPKNLPARSLRGDFNL